MRLGFLITLIIVSLDYLPAHGQGLANESDYVAKCLKQAAPILEYEPGVPSWIEFLKTDSLQMCEQAAVLDPENLIVQSALGNALYHAEKIPESLGILLELVEKKYPPAFSRLAGFYERGDGVQRDILKAEVYYQKAIEAGFKKAQIPYAKFILSEKKAKKDRAYARSMLDELLIEQNLPVYIESINIFVDDTFGLLNVNKAKNLALKAHDEGNYYGTLYLALSLLAAMEPGGDRSKLPKMKEYFELVAEQAELHIAQIAFVALGMLYQAENTQWHSQEAAEKWFLKAHDAEFEAGTKELIDLYANDGDFKDEARAIVLLEEWGKRKKYLTNLLKGHVLFGVESDFLSGNDEVEVAGERAKEIEKYYKAALEIDGDTEALLHLGRLYLQRLDWHPKNLQTAFDWHAKGDKAGWLYSTAELQTFKKLGVGTDQNFDESLQYLRELEENDQDLRDLFYRYQSLYFYILKAKNRGSFTGNIEELSKKVIDVAELYLKSLSNEEHDDDTRDEVSNKITEIKLSLGQGNISNYWNTLENRASEGRYSFQHLGYLHEHGVYGPVNLTKAVQFYKRSIDSKKDLYAEEAYNSLALLYKDGRGVEQNYQKAVALLKRALIMTEDDVGVAWDFEPWWCSCHLSRTNLADFYLNGLGVERDYHRAIWLLNSAVTTRHSDTYPEAAVKLGKIYDFGIGVKKDPSKAKNWYEKSLVAFYNLFDGLGPSEFKRRSENILRSATTRLSALQDTDTQSAANNYASSGNFVALLIAAENYEHMEDLKTPRNDIEEIGTILETRYGFETTALYDPTRADITKKLNQLKTELKKEDTLLIYYAGHGLEDGGDGFWLPVDAQKEDDTNWLANDYLTRKLRTIKATNILLIADSCYSGTLSRGIKISGSEQKKPAGNAIQLFSETKSRVVITSGNLEPVMDGGGGNHSVFARGLLEVLSTNKDIITATELYNQASRIVINDSLNLGKSQTPTIASLNSAGHIGPDVVFYAD